MADKSLVQGSKKQMKFSNYPYFLMKSNIEIENTKEVKKQPSTDRQSREFLYFQSQRV